MQCPKILWLDKHHPEFGENIANESVLDNGIKVGELARSYFGECELAGFNANKNEMVDRTKKLMDNGAEASASYADMVNHTPEEIAEMRENLLKYCGLDTYAMVKVLNRLKEIADMK